MNKPTDEQIREFWVKCGCYQSKMQLGTSWWFYPNKTIVHGLPPIDLNNLFKYAVPKLNKYRVSLSTVFNFNLWIAEIYDANNEGVCKDKDPALALFWAIWEVLTS